MMSDVLHSQRPPTISCMRFQISLTEAITLSCISRDEASMSIPLKILLGVSLVAQMVKNLPAVQETWVQTLGQEDPVEK